MSLSAKAGPAIRAVARRTLRNIGGHPDGDHAVGIGRRLTSLDLSQNQLRDISGLRDASALERLDLSQNQITDVSPLAGCAQLAALDLTDNPIQSAAPLMGLPVFDPAAPLGAPFTP